MPISPQERELIAVGASVATGCKPCTNYHVKAAREAGAPDAEIRQAVVDALRVRTNAAGVMRKHALSRLGKAEQQDIPVISGERSRMKVLVAVGAAFGVNCVSSLKRYLAAAETIGVSKDEVAEIIRLAATVREQAVSHVENVVGMREEDGPAFRRTARKLLDTYLGRHTSERVLRGLVRRGDGEDIHAVIWFCDLRDSTAMADSMPRPTFLGILNDFFDCTAGGARSSR
jgi:AhpD family alkylhydroperoxidase